jgi:hypothetical protein
MLNMIIFDNEYQISRYMYKTVDKASCYCFIRMLVIHAVYILYIHIRARLYIGYI